MNDLDRWYNRRFPVHSPERLAFLLAATVPIGLVVGLGRDLLGISEFSWSLYFGITFCMWIVVALGWYLAREGYGPATDEEEDGPYTYGWTPPAAGDGSAASTPPPPPPMVGLPEPEKRRPTRGTTPMELLLSMGFIFVGIRTVGWALMPEGFWSGLRVLIDLGAALLVIAIVATSFSLFILLLAAALISYPMAGLLHLFFFFLSGDDSIWGYWAFTFTIACLFAISFWFQIRALKRSRFWVDLPLWATSLGASLMMIVLAVTAATGDPNPVEGPQYAAASPAPVVDSGAPAGARSQEEAALTLLQAWSAGDRELASYVAYRSVVDALFSSEMPAGTSFAGCGRTASGWERCALASDQGTRLLGFQATAEGGYYVRFVELVPGPVTLSGGS